MMKRLSFALVVSCGLLAGCGDKTSGAGASSTDGNARIINGSEVSLADSPQMAQVVLLNHDGSETTCSGTIVGARHVMTAAHCLEGSYLAAFVRTATVSHTVLSTSVPSTYRIDTEHGAVFDDVAVLETEPLGLPALPILASSPVSEGTVFTTYGFGVDESGLSGTLRLGMFSASIVTPNHIFSGPYLGQGSNTCNGDSGGPAIATLVTPDGGVVFGIVGLVSTGSQPGCGEGDITLYANLQNAALLEFVASIVPDVSIL